LTSPTGWSCDDFPCEDDLDGWLKRLQVPPGFEITRYGQFPGQPQQITFGPDGRLYATVLENGTRRGSVYAMNAAGTVERITAAFESPVGLAFLPGTDILFRRPGRVYLPRRQQPERPCRADQSAVRAPCHAAA
ncbi:MAG: hypothetical protein DCC53_16580, partial [Chloroflexi bacterium]